MNFSVSFTEFFRALYNRDPFPWQRLLAERGAAGQWPKAISLPTASGKTACLDAAVYALAAQSDRPLSERTAPRRIWFVVDRRIVVDEAHGRAKNLADKLAKASAGPLKIIADRLHSLVGEATSDTPPLAVARLRGGTARDDTWAYDPAQPAILCSTVDQIGSSLLFRCYGHDDRTASIWAGLAAHDSLILLDEAHCAVPFLQTLRAVAAYRSESWADEPVVTPFAYTIFSATLPPDVARATPPKDHFPRDAERNIALDHPALAERLSARKPTRLVVAPKAKKDDPRSTLAAEIVTHAKRHLFDRPANFPDVLRLAVMVNRVATAQQVADLLTRELTNSENPIANIVLLTGRMRPLERDALVAQWSSLLRSDAEHAPKRPVIVVTTQCLEVGADFSFDALVTECASLDALRQRFGRLDRLGKFRHATATIVITEADTREPKADEADPIYGRAIYETWQWLQSISSPSEHGPSVDFSVQAMDAHSERLRTGKSGDERLAALLAPSLDAPILLPAHLDLLCQTAPCPDPEPDIALFLHGKRAPIPEVRVLWRADLPDDSATEHGAAVIDQLALVPPVSVEAISVPLHRLRGWLMRRASTLDEGDVEGRNGGNNEENTNARSHSRTRVPFFAIWAGLERSRISSDPRDIRGGDTIVLPASAGLDGLAQVPAGNRFGLGSAGTDLAEPAALTTRPRTVLRLRKDLWIAWSPPESFRTLLATAEAADFDTDEFYVHWDAVRQFPFTESAGESLSFPDWLPDVIAALGKRPRVERIEGTRGVILVGPKRNLAASEDDYADEIDALSESADTDDGGAITLAHHSEDVAAAVHRFAIACLTTPFQSAATLAAPLHDLGKLDPRFQVMLHGGDEATAEAGRPLAKSAELPRSKRHRLVVQEDQRLPRGFRHELLSLQIVEHLGLLPTSERSDLAAHLIASHHGHARPSAPNVPDPQPPVVDLAPLGLVAKLDETTRCNAPLTRFGPLDAQLVDRFWRLTRRHGWWGLAYIEAIFRLADWRASRRPSRRPKAEPRLSLATFPVAAPQLHHLLLPAIDGANPLGFLAALGTLRVLTLKRTNLRPALSWIPDAGKFVPRITTISPLEKDALTVLLVDRLATEHVFPRQITGNPERQKLKIEVDALRDCIAPIATTTALREFAAFWAAFFNETSARDGTALKSRFDFHSGQMKIVENVASLRGKVDAIALKHTLFDSWRYVPQPSLRWDPLDEKRLYALQANDPSNKPKNPILTDIGANLLAVEGLPYFPMAPDRFGSQAGFNHARYAEAWTWPLWEQPLVSDAIFSLLHTPREPTMAVRFFRSRMAESGKGYRSFSPGRAV